MCMNVINLITSCHFEYSWRLCRYCMAYTQYFGHFFLILLFKHILQSRFKSEIQFADKPCHIVNVLVFLPTYDGPHLTTDAICFNKEKNNISSTHLYFIYFFFFYRTSALQNTLRLRYMQLAEEYLSLFRLSVPHLFSLLADDSCSPKMQHW